MARKFKEKSAGQFICHCACPKCGSVDNGAVYLHDDDSHSFTCFGGSCDHSIVNFNVDTMEAAVYSGGRVIDWEAEMEKLEEVRDGLIAVDMKDRKLRADVYDLYGVKMELNSDGETVDAVYYPSYRDGKHVGYRNRKRYQDWHDAVKKDPKKLGVLKDFSGGIGDTKKGIELYGQHLFESGGKRIILCCGEEDTHTVYHMTSLMTKFDGGYPTVGTPSGENVAWIKPNLTYLSSFSEIYIVADQDEAGQKFQEDVCKLLPVGKVRKLKLPKGVKDPSDWWRSGADSKQRNSVAKQFYNALWNAEKYSPAGIVSMSEGWNSYINRGKDTLIRFPDSFGELNHKTCGGGALGEIVNIIAPSSVGKSSFVKEYLYEALHSTPYNQGILAFEETLDEFIEGMLSIHMSEQLNEIAYDERDRKREYEEFQKLLKLRPVAEGQDDSEASDRIHFLDDQGACSGEELLDKIDFMIKGLDCKIIVLDPVTLACSGDTDEDWMASEIVKRVKRHKLLWINVHHVRKSANGATANSEGGDLAEEDIKGTGAWFQTGMINLIFTRNKVHSNEVVKNTTRIKMSKCRRHGKSTGIAGYTYYNGETGRLELGVDPQETLEAEDAFSEGKEEKW